MEEIFTPSNSIGFITIIINLVMLRLNWLTAKRQIRSVAVLNNRQEEINIIRNDINELLALTWTYSIIQSLGQHDNPKLEKLNKIAENLSLFLNEQDKDEKQLIKQINELLIAIGSVDESKVSVQSGLIRKQTKIILQKHRQLIEELV